jgi:CubicO group peptidase (beta-lactamase class C family)
MKYSFNLILVVSLISTGFQGHPLKQADSLGIEKLVNESLRDNTTMADDIHSILLSKNGETIYSNYFNQYTTDSLNNLKSITKSMIGLLIGIAIEEGHIQNIKEPIVNFFVECQSKENKLEDKKEITIEDLLLMQSGIEWNNRALIKDEWWFNENPHCFLLREFPMDTVPGVKFSYNSGVAHLLSGIISRSTGQSTLEYATERIFSPLEIKNIRWGKDQKGEYFGNSEMYLKPSDLLIIGQMLANNGIYEGNQIVPQQWIEEMQDKAYNATPLMNYGYLWMTSKDESPCFYFAGGSGGQHLFIAPRKNIVLVTTGHWDNARSTMEIMRLGVKLIEKL